MALLCNPNFVLRSNTFSSFKCIAYNNALQKSANLQFFKSNFSTINLKSNWGKSILNSSKNHVNFKKRYSFARYLSSRNQNSPNEKEVQEVFIGEGTWQEVYKGVLTTQFKLLKMFSISTSLIGLSLQPVLYEKLGTVNLGVFLGLGSFIGVFTFVTPALIHWVSKKYVTRLEYDPSTDVYAATTLSFFLKEKKIRFQASDVVRPDVPGMFTSFVVDGRSLFVDPSMFEDDFHYTRIMGFDKPLDISLERDKKR